MEIIVVYMEIYFAIRNPHFYPDVWKCYFCVCMFRYMFLCVRVYVCIFVYVCVGGICAHVCLWRAENFRYYFSRSLI